MRSLGCRLGHLGCVVGVGLLAGCTPNGDTQPTTSSAVVIYAAAPLAASKPRPVECMAVPGPVTIEALNARFEAGASTPYFRGADVGASVELRDGRRVWLYGDTVRDPDVVGGLMVRNSMLLEANDCLRPVLGAGGAAVIPDRADGVGYWPMSAMVIPDGRRDEVVVFAQRVTGAGQSWSFTTLGAAVAVFRVEPGGEPELLAVHDVGADDANLQRPAWGAASMMGADGFAYLYGSAKPNDGSTSGQSAHVARAPIGSVTDPGTWTYWDGSEWQGDPTSAVALVDAIGGMSQTFSAFVRDGEVYLLSKRDGVLGEDLVVWRADRPEGPFTVSAPLAHLPSNLADGQFTYMPLAHPDLLSANGSMVVSVSHNFSVLRRVLDNPALYRPTFMRVQLPT